MLYGRGMHMHVQSLLTQHGCMVMGAIIMLFTSQSVFMSFLYSSTSDNTLIILLL